MLEHDKEILEHDKEMTEYSEESYLDLRKEHPLKEAELFEIKGPIPAHLRKDPERRSGNENVIKTLSVGERVTRLEFNEESKLYFENLDRLPDEKIWTLVKTDDCLIGFLLTRLIKKVK